MCACWSRPWALLKQLSQSRCCLGCGLVGPWNHVLSTRLGPVTSVGRSTCGGTQWRRQAWSTGARAPWSLMHAPIFPYTLGKRIVYFLLPEAFYGLEYAENAIVAGAPPRTPLGELTTLPRPSSRLGSGHPSPYTTPLGTFGASMLAPSAPQSSCPPWHQILATPLRQAVQQHQVWVVENSQYKV